MWAMTDGTKSGLVYRDRKGHSMRKLSRTQITRLLLAFVIGCAVAILPNVTANWPESGFAGLLKGGIQWLLMPGVVLVMILYRNVHNYSLWVLEVTNVVFYSWLAYYLMKRKQRKGD